MRNIKIAARRRISSIQKQKVLNRFIYFVAPGIAFSNSGLPHV